jgi:hypothetical protein
MVCLRNICINTLHKGDDDDDVDDDNDNNNNNNNCKSDHTHTHTSFIIQNAGKQIITEDIFVI